MDSRDAEGSGGKSATLDDLAARLGRSAGRLVKGGRPELARLISKGKPLAHAAGKDALRYAREHEEEIKRTALKGARLHLRGPLGYVVGALANGLSQQPDPASTGVTCPGCGWSNAPRAKFCNQCGSKLQRPSG